MHPDKLYVEITSRCNLQCTKCVKHSPGCSIAERDMPLEVFKRLLPSFSKIQKLILNGIGEPLLHADLVEIIRLSRDAMENGGSIGFQSNGLLLSQNLAGSLLKAGLDTICLSMDEIQPPNPRQLHPLEHSSAAVSCAVVLLAEARKRINRKFTIGIQTVLRKSTIGQLPAIIRWAADNGVDYILTSHLIAYDKESENESLFNANSADAVNLYTRYRRMAAAEEIDLQASYARYRRYAGTRSGRKELRLIEDLQSDARQKDTRLNLTSLIAHDNDERLKAGGILAEANEIAADRGIEIHLPPLQANDRRSCLFVEEKAAFVATSGDVMPCHFLWHTYRCRLEREDIQVDERTFGNIQDQRLEDIWQRGEYAEFRREAGRYDFSHCWSCPQAPCASLVNDNLLDAYDCYGSRVPCGHCLWNLGGLRCL